jgi:high affinity sulfate transporter 1
MPEEERPREADTEETASFGSQSDGEPINSKGRPRFQSIHRRNLNRITEDAAQGVKYTVPDKKAAEVKNWRQKAGEKIEERYHSRSRDEWIGTFLPCYQWLRVYDWRTKLFTDVLAGITVGVMVVPQSMSYAKLAGLPVEYGLYSALFPVWAYALFGSSRQLAVGPVALVSLLLSTGLSNQMEKMGIGQDDANYTLVYTTLAIQVSFLVGILNIVMGLLRLGFVTIFLSHAVVSGFTTGAAVIIGVSQVKHIFGVDASGKRLHELLKSIFDDIENFNYKTFLMGTFAVITLVFLKYIGKRYPKFKSVRALGPLVVTAITIAITWGFDLSEKGIPIVSTIPRGFPAFTGDIWFPMGELGGIFQISLSVTIIGFMESIAIAKQLASKHNYELDSSLELIGLGMANLFGAMFQAYPVTGSFSRSAVNNEAGAQSGLSGLVTASLVGLVLLFLTSVFEQMVSLNCLPRCCYICCFSLANYVPNTTALSRSRRYCDIRGPGPLGLRRSNLLVEGSQVRLWRVANRLLRNHVPWS